MIALLTPTRGRPIQFERMCRTAYATSSLNMIDIRSGSNSGREDGHKSYAIDCPTVHMWNDLARIAFNNPANKLFMLTADDVIFSTPGWDEALLDHYNALENKIHVYHLQDSRDAEGTPHPIVTREYIAAMGYFMPPLFLHWYVDTWTREIAKANHCFTHLKDYLLIHDKPSDRGQADETHNHIRTVGWHSRDSYVDQTCQHFLELEKSRLAKAM